MAPTDSFLLPAPAGGELIVTRRPAPSRWSRLRRVAGWPGRHPTLVTIAGSLLVAAALVIGLWDKRDEFATAFAGASLLILGTAVLLQVIWLVARSEAWHVCVGAAGGKVDRRRLYRAASVGYLGNVFNANVGLAVRIAALRRSAPADSPRPSVLVGSELPIIVVEVVLAAVMSFTLIGPLGLPLWVPPALIAVAVLIFGGFTKLSRRSHQGIWKGLAIMRGLRGRNAIVALVIAAVGIQVLRNWLVLYGIGIEISLFEAVALLIAAAAIGMLPVGPSLGAATAVLILGSNGVAIVAAAGALLTATGAIGAVCFASWALVDRLRRTAPLPAAASP